MYPRCCPLPINLCSSSLKQTQMLRMEDQTPLMAMFGVQNVFCLAFPRLDFSKAAEKYSVLFDCKQQERLMGFCEATTAARQQGCHLLFHNHSRIEQRNLWGQKWDSLSGSVTLHHAINLFLLINNRKR